jgi:hypothetical protein
MYPPGVYTERIADAIVEMFQPGASTSAELFFEERDLFVPVEEEAVDEADRLLTIKGWTWMICLMMISKMISKKKELSKI